GAIESLEHRAEPDARLAVSRPAAVLLGDYRNEQMARLAGGLGREAADQLLATRRLVRHDERDSEGQALLGEVDDYVLDRQPGGSLDALDQIPAQPPGLCRRMGRDDHLVRAAVGDRVHRGRERVGVADFAGCRDPLARQQRHREVDAHLRRFADRLVVDHEAGGRLGLRHDQPEAHLAGGGALAHRIEQLLPAEGAIGDYQDFAHRASLSYSVCLWTTPEPPAAPPTVAGTGAGANVPCTAPGTPYSYGLPTTVGMRSKLNTGGGEDTCHSIVSPRHGFAGARGPPRQLVTML